MVRNKNTLLGEIKVFVDQIEGTLKQIKDSLLRHSTGKTLQKNISDEFIGELRAAEGFSSKPYYDVVYDPNEDGGHFILVVVKSMHHTTFHRKNNLHQETVRSYTKQDLKKLDMSKATLTIGIGTTADVYKEATGNELTYDVIIDLDEACRLVRHFFSDIAKKLQICPNQAYFNAMLDFTYNTGAATLDKKGETRFCNEWAPTAEKQPIQAFSQVKEPKTFLELIKEGNHGAVARRLSWYRKSGGKVIKGLVDRRNRTIRDIFLSLNDD